MSERRQLGEEANQGRGIAHDLRGFVENARRSGNLAGRLMQACRIGAQGARALWCVAALSAIAPASSRGSEPAARARASILAVIRTGSCAGSWRN